MSGTPEKILEHLLETIKLESNGNDATGKRYLFSVVEKNVQTKSVTL